MGRAPGMTLPRRHMVIGMLNAGMTAREVARQFHVSESTQN
jgi:DNA-binding NarL/FixJ family response regulator